MDYDLLKIMQKFIDIYGFDKYKKYEFDVSEVANEISLLCIYELKIYEGLFLGFQTFGYCNNFLFLKIGFSGRINKEITFILLSKNKKRIYSKEDNELIYFIHYDLRFFKTGLLYFCVRIVLECDICYYKFHSSHRKNASHCCVDDDLNFITINDIQKYIEKHKDSNITYEIMYFFIKISN